MTAAQRAAKIAKIQTLADRGATHGERMAARAALERLRALPVDLDPDPIKEVPFPWDEFPGLKRDRPQPSAARPTGEMHPKYPRGSCQKCGCRGYDVIEELIEISFEKPFWGEPTWKKSVREKRVCNECGQHRFSRRTEQPSDEEKAAWRRDDQRRQYQERKANPDPWRRGSWM